MAECGAVRERFPELVIHALGTSEREETLVHIEACRSCESDWAAFRATWNRLGELEELSVPDRLRASFLARLEREQSLTRPALPFRHRRPIEWLAKAAAVAIVVGGSFVVGRSSAPSAPEPAPATLVDVQPISVALAESLIIPASRLSPEITGNPDIRNLSVEPAEGEDQVRVSFDITSTLTITGTPDDKSLIQLLSYLVQSQKNPTHSRSRVMQWVKDAYDEGSVADPEIVRALANVLVNDTHEGVRIKAVDTLRTLPGPMMPEARAALVQALRSDPNPAVRMKAVDALARFPAGSEIDEETRELLRAKASQGDENPYVRVRAAEALSGIDF